MPYQIVQWIAPNQKYPDNTTSVEICQLFYAQKTVGVTEHGYSLCEKFGKYLHKYDERSGMLSDHDFVISPTSFGGPSFDVLRCNCYGV